MNNIFSANKYWAMDEAVLKGLPERAKALQQAPQSQPDSYETDEYVVINGVAIIPVVGPVAKYNDIFMQVFGGTSTMEAKNNVQSALDDDSVSAIMVYIDSPGEKYQAPLISLMQLQIARNQ